MKWSPLSRFSAHVLLWSIVGLMFTNIALGQAAESESNQPVSQDEVVSEPNQPEQRSNVISEGLAKVGQTATDVINGITGSGLPGKFTADGAPLELRHIGLTITPPQGWEITTSDPSLTLIMQEPESSEIVYDKPIYRRNITVAKVAEPSPIDEQRAKQLKEELLATFGSQAGVQNFQIVEHKFFDYRGKNDGLLVYTGFTMGENALMQLHVLTSDAKRQFLMTYTDFAERFQNEQLFNEAWSTIATASITGEPPSRWMNLIVGSVSAFVMILGLLLVVILRHRRATNMYMNDADVVYRDDTPSTRVSARTSWAADASNDNEDLTITQTGVWNLRSSGYADDDDWDLETDSHSSKPSLSDGWNIHRNGEGSEEDFSLVTNFR